MQGVSDAGGTATEFAGTQQMAAGRMANIARLISVQAIVPQTKQFVSMFQQFLDDRQKIRYQPDPFNSPPQMLNLSFLDISKDTIQGEFDFIAHDGSLPNGDSKQVAAITRLLQVAQGFPQIFQPGKWNLDPRALVMAGAKASGLKNLDRFFYDPSSFQAGVGGQVSAAMPGMVPQEPPQVAPPAAPIQPPEGLAGNTPGPAPAQPELPPIEPANILPLAPTQPRPENI
jgi:hypothetical protein